MGHVVNPVVFRLNFSKYWLNLHSEKKNSNYLNFSDYILLFSLKRLLKKRVFFRFKLVFDRLTFIHRHWQDLLLLKFKYSKYTKKKPKKGAARIGLKNKISNIKKNVWSASRSYFGMFSRIELHIALSTTFDFFEKINFSVLSACIKKPFYAKELSYFRELTIFSKKFFRWYDKPLFIYNFSDYFFKFINFKKNLSFFFKPNKLFINFNIINFFQKEFSDKKIKLENFFFKSRICLDEDLSRELVDINFFRLHYLNPKFLSYPKKSFKRFRATCISGYFGKFFYHEDYLTPILKKFITACNTYETEQYAKNRNISFKGTNKKLKTKTINFFLNKNKKKQKKRKKNLKKKFKKTKEELYNEKMQKKLSRLIIATQKQKLSINNSPSLNFKKRVLDYIKLSVKERKDEYKSMIKKKKLLKNCVIFYKPFKEALDLTFAEKNLPKAKRKYILFYYMNMPEWDKSSLKKIMRKRKKLFKIVGPLRGNNLKRLRLRKKNSFFKKINSPKYKKEKKNLNKAKRLANKNFNWKQFLTFSYGKSAKLNNLEKLEFLSKKFYTGYRGSSSNFFTDQAFYDYLQYNYGPFGEINPEVDYSNSDDSDDESDGDTLDFYARWVAGLTLKNLLNKNLYAEYFFELKQKFSYKLEGMLFGQILRDAVFGSRFNFCDLRKLDYLFKKYQKIYYSTGKNKKKKDFIKYGASFIDRFRINTINTIYPILHVKRWEFRKHFGHKEKQKRLFIKKMIQRKHYNLKKRKIIKLFKNFSVFKKKLDYYYLKRTSKRFYKSTYWYLKNNKSYKKNILKINYLFNKSIIYEKNNSTFLHNLDHKEKLVSLSFINYLTKKQNTMIINDYSRDLDHSKKYYTKSLFERITQLENERKRVLRFVTDPGLKIGIQQDYQEISIKKILHYLEKKITKLKKLKKKSWVYEKEKLTPRRQRRLMWFNARYILKNSKKTDSIKNANKTLLFLKKKQKKNKMKELRDRCKNFKNVRRFLKTIKWSTKFYFKKYYIDKMLILKNFYNKIFLNVRYLEFTNFKKYFIQFFFFAKSAYKTLVNFFFYLKNKSFFFITYNNDIFIFNKKFAYNSENFLFTKDIFNFWGDRINKNVDFKFFYKNKNWVNFIWNFYFSAKKSIYNKYFIKFFKKIYKLKFVLLNFISNFYFINNTKIYFFIFKKKFIPAVTSFLNFFFYRIRGVKVKYHIKRTLKLLEKYFKYKIFSGYKFCLSGRYRRRDRADFKWQRDGLLPLTDKFSPVHYGFYFNSFRYGAVNVKFWILLKSSKKLHKNSLFLSSLMTKV